MKLNIKSALLFCAMVLLFTDPAYAAGGIEKVNETLELWANIFRGAAIISVTVAIMWAGYKLLFTRAEMMEIGKIAGGGLLIGASAEIARYLIS